MRAKTGIGITALLLAGCASSSTSTSSSSPSLVQASPVQASPSPSATSSSAAPTGLIGLGATDAVWNSRHQADTSSNRQSGCCYRPLQADGSSHYAAVSHTNGHVQGWQFVWNPDVAEAAAKREILAELPSDVVAAGTEKQPNCLTLNFHSAVLAVAVGKDDPDGAISVTLDTLPGSTYNPSHVGDAAVGEAITPGVSC